MTAALLLFIKPVENLPKAVFVDQLEFCGDSSCADEDRKRVQLPWRSERPSGSGHLTRYFIIPQHFLSSVDPETDVLYFPVAPRGLKLMGHPDVFWAQDGSAIYTPKVFELDSRSEQGEGVSILKLTYSLPDGLVLHPFHIGQPEDMRWAYFFALVLTPGLAITSMVLMVASFALCLPIYLYNRNDKIFLWLALMNVPGFFIGAGFLLPVDYGAPGRHFSFVTLGADYVVTCLFCFMNRLVNVNLRWLERINFTGLGIHTLSVIFLPVEYLIIAAAVWGVWSITWAVIILTVFQLNREALNKLSYFSLFCLLTLSLALASHDWIAGYTMWQWGAGTAGQALALVLGIATLWLVVRRLVTSVASLQNLNRSLDQTVALKTKELADSYAALAETRTQAALNDERNRINTELHDGVGGSLVNILAYTEESDQRDPVLEQALEDVVREIGVIMDNVATLDAPLEFALGGLRHRYGALFERLGVEIIWNVNEAPVIAPEQKLNFVRIIQEALNNVAKHAQASQITITSDRNHVCVEDNGLGVDTSRAQKRPAPAYRLSSGLGLQSMKTRAAALSADLEIKDIGTGTRVSLVWPSGA